MKEELTTAMHAEFQVSKQTDTKHRTFAALEMYSNGVALKLCCETYEVTRDDLAINLSEFNRLFLKKVVLE